jgi:hypothetical protein
MRGRDGLAVLFAASLIVATGAFDTAAAQQINTLQELFARLGSCWKAPPLPSGDSGMQIAVSFSLKRNGEILGQPRITYESAYATNDQKMIYRMAVMEALQRCTPMPITDGLGNAIAGRPLLIRFDARRMKSTEEKRQWQTTTTL